MLCARCPLPLSFCSPLCPLGVLCRVCGVFGTLLPFTGVLLWCAVCAASLATLLLFTGVPAWCVVLRVRCCWPLGSCSSACLCLVLCARCPWPLCSCSLVCPLGVLCCVWRVLGHLAPVHRCARSVLCVCCVLGHVTPVRCCSRSVCCVLCAVSFATWLLIIGVPAQCVWLCVRCLLPPGSRSPVCPLAVLCCGFGVLGDLAPVDRVARSVCCVLVCGVLCHLDPVHQFARGVGFWWCAAAGCAFVCPLWFLRAPGLLACPTHFWCCVFSLGWLW